MNAGRGLLSSSRVRTGAGWGSADLPYGHRSSCGGMWSLLPSLKFFSHEAVSLCWFAWLAQACLTGCLHRAASLYIGSFVFEVKGVPLPLSHRKNKIHITCVRYEEAQTCSFSSIWRLICGFLLLSWLVADPGKSVMSARFRLPAGRSYNVRATELERDRQHTQVVCNVLLLDNTVQAFKVSVSTPLNFNSLRRTTPSHSSHQISPFAYKSGSFVRSSQQRHTHLWTSECNFDGIRV